MTDHSKGWEAVWEAAKRLDVHLSGLSWNGFNVAGDTKSMTEVRRLMDLEDRLKWFEREYKKEHEADVATAPIPMLLCCPICSERHVDVGEFATKVHTTHACRHCGHVWRPAIVATVGVRFLPGFKDEG